MPIIRVKKDKDNPYVMINKTIFLNDKISARAKGVFAYLMTLPDDWDINILEIAAHFKEGQRSIYNVFKELMQHKYVQRKKLRSKDGSFEKTEYVVYEIPLGKNCNVDETVTVQLIDPLGKNPHVENPHVPNPHVEKSVQLNNNSSTDIIFSKEKSAKPQIPEKMNAPEIVKYFCALFKFYNNTEYSPTWTKDPSKIKKVWIDFGPDIFCMIDHYLALEDNPKVFWSTKPRTISNFVHQRNEIKQHWKEYA